MGLIGSVFGAIFGSDSPGSESVPFLSKIEPFNEGELKAHVFKIKGMPNINHSRNINMIIKLNDKKTGLPILSNFDEFSENNSRVYEINIDLGRFEIGNYWADWVQIGGFTDEMIMGPHKGKREIEAKMVICDASNLPVFSLGQLADTSKVLDFTVAKLNYNFKDSGYNEVNKERLRIQEIAIELAIGISMSDGDFDEEEGLVIQRWIREIIDLTKEGDKDKIKKSLNNALERGYNNYNSGNFKMTLLCNEVKRINATGDKYELIELCLDVMAADGVADNNELEIIRKISEKINIDYDEMIKLKDRRMINLVTNETPVKAIKLNIKSIEESLGIDSSWDMKRKKKFTRSEFTKWNARMSSLEGKEKINAQKKLNIIAEARKYYD